MAPARSRRRTTRTTIPKDVSGNEPNHTPLTRLSLCTLPMDILLQIIDYVSLNISQENVDLAAHRLTRASIVPVDGHQSSYINFLHDLTPILNSLQSLGAVSRMFYQLCRPRLWSQYHFPTLVSIPIEFYITDIFPKQGSFIKKLSIELSPECCSGPRPSTRQRTAKQVYDNTTKTRLPAASAALGPVSLAHMAQRDREPLSGDSALQLVSLCPNLRSLTIDLPKIERNKHAGRSKTNLEALLLSFVPHVTALEELIIHQNPGLPMPDLCMSKVIRQLPLLKSLSLTDLVSSPRTKDSESLGWHMAHLQHLTQLHLFCTNSAHENWCDYPWPKSIKELRLERCDTLSPKTTHRLIQSMAPNVIRLALGYGFHGLGEEEGRARLFDYQYDLPSLTDLTLDIHAPPDLINCFKDCKNLRRLKYNKPTMADWRTLTELVPSQTWPLLERIDLRQSAFDMPVSTAFRESCDKAGIWLVLRGSPKPSSSDWDEWEDEMLDTNLFEDDGGPFDGEGDEDDDMLPHSAAMLMLLYLYFEEVAGMSDS